MGVAVRRPVRRVRQSVRLDQLGQRVRPDRRGRLAHRAFRGLGCLARWGQLVQQVQPERPVWAIQVLPVQQVLPDRQALLVALLERPEQLVPQVRWVRKVWQEHLEQLVLQGRLAQPERPVQMV